MSDNLFKKDLVEKIDKFINTFRYLPIMNDGGI